MTGTAVPASVPRGASARAEDQPGITAVVPAYNEEATVESVLDVLASLRPMASVGPVTLEEARDVLRGRLVTLDWPPPLRRYGRVFVGTPHQARGRTFRVVFVPGLAERVVPQRPHEDPGALGAGGDDSRTRIAGCPDQ